MHLVGDLFEVYDDARTYKPYQKKKKHKCHRNLFII